MTSAVTVSGNQAMKPVKPVVTPAVNSEEEEWAVRSTEFWLTPAVKQDSSQP